jgi:PPOX class probable F420-dependent enzyme
MSPGEVDDFLAGRHTMTMCTINHDGTIHAVAMWYGFLDGAIAIETKTRSQKVSNLRRDPTMTVLVDDGDRYEELRGVELVGRGEIVEEPAQVRALARSVLERYHGPIAGDVGPMLDAMVAKRVAVRLHVDRVVSWANRKLTGG